MRVDRDADGKVRIEAPQLWTKGGESRRVKEVSKGDDENQWVRYTDHLGAPHYILYTRFQSWAAEAMLIAPEG